MSIDLPGAPVETPEPLATVARLLREALALRDASLVIYRRGVLVEFKTDLLLEKLSVWNEEGHRSWQIGAFDDHHCHLALDAINEVHLDAEPVSCQGGRINYTIGFLCDHDCGNPYRPRGLFSVTLNRPYEADGTLRKDILAPLVSLAERAHHCSVVTASREFEEAIEAAALT
jgi:hypothetical protein